MVRRCKNCKEKIIPFPLWKGQERDVPFSWDKILWLNWFKMDFRSIILIVVLATLILGYKADISKCEDVIEHPCEFCEDSNSARVFYPN